MHLSPVCTGSVLSAALAMVNDYFQNKMAVTNEIDFRADDSAKTERGDRFWNNNELQMKFCLEHDWIKSARRARGIPNYGMGQMIHGLEEICGNKVELAGPMIDSFLFEIGQQMYSKLTRSKLTSLATPITLFVPWQVFKHITVISRGYGGDIETEKNKIKIFATQMSTLEKLFSPSRFSGENFIRKRHFCKQPDDCGKVKSVYTGRSAVVVSKSTPFVMDYNLKRQKLVTLFYIQRYTSEDFSVDASLQNIINQEQIIGDI